jgi:hypothetical protein
MPELAEKQTAIIRKVASMHNNFDAMQITSFVNQLFAKMVGKRFLTAPFTT